VTAVEARWALLSAGLLTAGALLITYAITAGRRP